MRLITVTFFARGLSNKNVTRFFVRRTARIYPLYLFMVLAQVICALSTQGGFQTHDNPYAAYLPNPASDILANLLLVQSWGLTNSIVGTAWSISTELAAYLMFPFLVVPALCARLRTTMVIGCAAVPLLTPPPRST